MKPITLICICITALIADSAQAKEISFPLVLWHGMGDDCCSFGMERIADLVDEEIPGIYVHSLMLGKDEDEDAENGFFTNVNTKVQMACDIIRNDTKLKNGYNAVGLSQGSQFLRAVAQRCPEPPMKNLISLGGQHQGVYGLPNCPGRSDEFCDEIRRLLHLGAYWEPIQEGLVQAQYWHDPLNEQDYKNLNIFLADINQEKTVNPTYKKNLMQLKNFVMVKFSEDNMVDPKESQWFGFYKPGQGNETETLQDSEIYKQDKLGLAQMEAEGRLKFLTAVGEHLQFSDEWFIKEIVKPYL